MTRLDFWQFWNSLNFVCAPPVVQAPFPFCFSLLWKETFVFCLSNSQKTNYNHLAPIGTQMGFLHLFTFYKKHLYIFLHFTFKKSTVTFSYISFSGAASLIFLHFTFRKSMRRRYPGSVGYKVEKNSLFSFQTNTFILFLFKSKEHQCNPKTLSPDPFQ